MMAERPRMARIHFSEEVRPAKFWYLRLGRAHEEAARRVQREVPAMKMVAAQALRVNQRRGMAAKPLV